MTSPRIETGNIIAWSRTREAQGDLPRLVRRLILAMDWTARVDMPDGDGVQRSGADGRVETTRPMQFVPMGRSIWELTVRNDAEKLNTDYDARIGLATDGAGGGDATYVAVSARRVSAKKEWAEERRKAGPWRDVLVYDADDLAQWLDAAPAVARAFAAEVGLPASDVATLHQHLEAWETRTSAGRFPRQALLAGGPRERAAHALRERLRESSTDPIYVEGVTRSDALDFIAGALALDDDPASAERWAASTLIVESREDLARLVRSPVQSPLVLVPNAIEIEHLSFPHDPSRRLVVPVASGASWSGEPIQVPPPELPDVVAILASHGFEPDEAERNAAESGGNLDALRRRYGAGGGDPPWSLGADAPALLGFILAESWAAGATADEAWLADLTGLDATALRAAWAALELHPNSPVARGRSHSHDHIWERHTEAWGWLARLLSIPMLDRFASAARQVLASDARRTTQRGLVSGETGVVGYSGLLRSGIARSLARLARWSDRVGQDAATHRRAKEIASEVVTASLGVSWKQWKALRGSLRTLAEAAPESFLRALGASLEQEEGAHHLLDEDGAQSDLLWALETLGWRRRYLSEVTILLAKLAEYDRKLTADTKRMANRPLRSLAHLVAPTIAQTEATWPERRAALLQLREHHADLVFELLLGHVPQPIGEFVLSSPRPRFVSWKLPSMDEVFARARTESPSAISDSVDDVIAQAGVDVERWERLIDRVRVARVDIQSHVLDALDRQSAKMQSPDGRMWTSLRHWLSTRAHRSQPERPCLVHKRLCALYDKLAPTDPVARDAWLFASLRPDLPDPVGTFDEEMAEVERRRIAFVERVWTCADRPAVLSRIAASAEATSAWRLGIAIASSAHALEAESLLLPPQPDRWIRETASVFVARRAEDAGDDWLLRVLETWRIEGRLEDVFDVVSRCPTTQQTWAVIDALGEPTRSRYWKEFRAFPAERSEAAIRRGVEACLAVGNPEGAAMVAWAVGGQVSGTTAMEILRSLAPVARSLDEMRAEIKHPVEELFARLVELGETTDEEGADLELALRPVFGPFHGPDVFIGRILAKDPERFVAFVCHAFPDARDQNGERSPVESLRSTMLSHVVSDWRGYPGDDLAPGEVRDALVYQWARAALEATARRGRVALGELTVAAVLQRVATPPGEPWPALPVRRLLEEESDPDRPLASSLANARFNARGMTSRETVEGGYQERKLGADYRLAADAIRAKFPKTADMLTELALSYDRDGRREDEWAQGVARLEGMTFDQIETGLRKLRGIDVALAVCLALHPHLAAADAATRLGVAPPDGADSVARLAAAGIADATERTIDILGLLELLRGNLRSVFPPVEEPGLQGEVVRGVHTGIDGVDRLRGLLAETGEPRVWKASFGDAFGVSIQPLCPNAARLKTEDRQLFEALALVDALRFGTARERNIARDDLRKLLLSDPHVAQVAQ